MKKEQLETMLKTTVKGLDDNKVAWTEKWKIIDLKQIGTNYLDLLEEDITEKELSKISDEIEEYIVSARVIIDNLDELK
ncbi:MAG: hypothetical protein PHF17_08395 [Arcobacteraceae bacterium]|nr:hypothetical protein [Arcobacteraceae bacterium]